MRGLGPKAASSSTPRFRSPDFRAGAARVSLRRPMSTRRAAPSRFSSVISRARRSSRAESAIGGGTCSRTTTGCCAAAFEARAARASGRRETASSSPSAGRRTRCGPRSPRSARSPRTNGRKASPCASGSGSTRVKGRSRRASTTASPSTVPRASAAACKGGEILVSQATSALLDDEEHDGSAFMLVDLGEQQLKDFERPVRVYQLMAAEFPSSSRRARRRATAASAC